MKEIDGKLGKPLPEKSYANNCVLYDYSKPEDPWHNIKVCGQGVLLSQSLFG